MSKLISWKMERSRENKKVPDDPGLFVFFWWTLQDSNLRPTGYEPAALTNCAKGPNGGGSETRTHDLPGMNRML